MQHAAAQTTQITNGLNATRTRLYDGLQALYSYVAHVQKTGDIQALNAAKDQYNAQLRAAKAQYQAAKNG